jgi:hypothetical protein
VEKFIKEKFFMNPMVVVVTVIIFLIVLFFFNVFASTGMFGRIVISALITASTMYWLQCTPSSTSGVNKFLGSNPSENPGNIAQQGFVSNDEVML